MNRTKSISILHLYLIFLPVLAFSQQTVDSVKYPRGIPSITTYTPDDYHAHIQNWCSTQGEDGIMYFGNTAGVLEFDGVSWRLIPLPNGAPAKSMATSADGVIYVGGVRELGFLQPDSTGQMQFVSLVAELDTAYHDFVDVWFTYAIGNTIYFISDPYVFEWKSSQFRVWKAKQKFGYASKANKRIYVTSYGVGMMTLQNDSLLVIEGGSTFYDRAGAITTMQSAKNKGLIAGSFSNGLYLYDQHTIQPFNKEGKNLLAGMAIYNSAVLPNGDYVFVTLGNGCFIVSPAGEVKLWLSEKTGLPSNSIYGAFVDKKGGLWLASEKGIAYVDISSPVRIFNEYFGLTEGVERILYHQGRIYISSIDGVYYLTEVAPNKWKRQYHFKKIKGIEQMSWYLAAQGKDLFVGNFDAVYQIYPNNNVRRLIPDNTGIIESSEMDSNRIFAGTMYGKIYSLRKINSRWLVDDSVLTVEGRILGMVENEDGSMWLSTRYNGVYKLTFPSTNANRSFKGAYNISHYDTLDGLPGMSYNFVGQARGQVYFSSPTGIYTFNAATQRFLPDSLLMNQLNLPQTGFENIIRPAKDGEMWIARNINFVNKIFKTKNGSLKEVEAMRRFPNFIVYEIEEIGDIAYFGGPKGIISYRIKSNKHNGKPFSTRIRQVTVDNDSLIFAGHLSVVSANPKIALPYKLNSLRFSYSLPSYAKPEANQYQYYLEGFDEGWSDWSNNTERNFTNLPAGDYIFHVRARDVYGRLSSEANYAYTILAPWYQTWWAYILYLLLLLAGIFGIVKWRFRHLESEKEMLENLVAERTYVVEQQAEQLKSLDEAKSRFFTNISHEFRTPLTLILGEITQLEKNKLPEINRRPIYQVMKRSGRRLLVLVNQLLDLSTLEAGAMKPEAMQTDLIAFLKPIAAAYESLAESKNITFTFEHCEKPFPIYIDRDKMQKVVHNLLANAFKFTNEDGVIILKASTENLDGAAFAQIEVQDNGPGIDFEKQPHIFDRFYQVDDTTTRQQEGTGIGLALAKELTELHYGEISLRSKFGQGAAFSVLLPLGKEHFSDEEIVEQPVPVNTFEKGGISLDLGLPIQTQKDISEKKPDLDVKTPRILVVEDNTDMQDFICEIISPHYRFMKASDGKDGWEKAIEEIPDLIISDVMMPVMDGIELCGKLKQDERTSHIPVVLLTAKAGKASKMEGLQTRADDYITKPFDADELLVLLRNRIEQRAKLRERFSKEISLQPQDIAITSADERFLQRAMDIVEENMEAFDFDVEAFVEKMQLSQRQTARKLKSLTNLSPVQFIRFMRLKRAAQKISKNEDTISQIAYSVGFNSLSYFTECFKKQFGQLPSEYDGSGSKQQQ